ncbi:MAG TPA: hypothetical protein VF880_17035 [Actinomycetes bacterium]
MEARHRRRVHQAQHQAAKQVVALALQQRVGTLLVGDPTGITKHDAGRVQDWRLRQWRRTHLLQALHDKAEQAGIDARRRSCLASATHPDDPVWDGCRSLCVPDLAPGEDQARRSTSERAWRGTRIVA